MRTTCAQCRQPLTLGEKSWCRECRKLASRPWYVLKAPPSYSDHAAARGRWIRSLSPGEFDRIVNEFRESQNFQCGVCKKDKTLRLVYRYEGEGPSTLAHPVGLACHGCSLIVGKWESRPGELLRLYAEKKNPRYLYCWRLLKEIETGETPRLRVVGVSEL